MADDPAVPILWSVLSELDKLRDMTDPVLEDRVEFLRAYVYEILRLKDPFEAIAHLSDR